MMSLPLLESMMPTGARANEVQQKRFFNFFYPNGTCASEYWNIQSPNKSTRLLSDVTLSSGLRDLGGFNQEKIWPASSGNFLNDITVVHNCHINDVYPAGQIHQIQSILRSERGAAGASLDRVIADRYRDKYPARPYLIMSGSGDVGRTQGFTSWENSSQPSEVKRDPQSLFYELFTGSNQETIAAQKARENKSSILDFVLDDASRLKNRLGRDDKHSVDEFMDSVRTVELQVSDTSGLCSAENITIVNDNWHGRAKSFLDIAIMALKCDITPVVSYQYSNSWGVHYDGYNLAGESRIDGYKVAWPAWVSDHFLSHRSSGRDKSPDLTDSMPNETKAKLTHQRLVLTSQFKVRRFCYVVDRLRNELLPDGSNLLDHTLVLYNSEHGTGYDHSTRNLPVLIGGLPGNTADKKRGKLIFADRNIQALHCSILNCFDFDLQQYGNPALGPLANI